MPGELPLQVTVRFNGTRADLLARLRAMPAALSGMPVRGIRVAQKAWRACALELLEIIRESFEEKGTGAVDRAGVRWRPLTPQTIRAKKLRYRSKKKQEGALANPETIGVDTGALLRSLSPGRPGNILEVYAGGARVGSSIDYADEFHKERPMWPGPGKGEWPVLWLERLGIALGNAVAQGLIAGSSGVEAAQDGSST